jgi:hypothetical protein
MIPRQKTILLALAALLALAIAGCGGGDGTTESTAAATTEESPTLTKEELISQGDAICAEVNAAVGALGSSETEAAIGGESEKIANLYTGMVQSLQNLGTPEEDDGSYAQFSEAAEELAKVEGEIKLASEREDTPALEEAETAAGPALEEFQSEAAIFGFEDCSEGPSAPTPAGGAEAGEEAEGEYEEGGVEAEPEIVEPEVEEEAAPEEVAPETGGAGGGEEAPEAAPEAGGGSESGGVGPG